MFNILSYFIYIKVIQLPLQQISVVHRDVQLKIISGLGLYNHFKNISDVLKHDFLNNSLTLFLSVWVYSFHQNVAVKYYFLADQHCMLFYCLLIIFKN